VQVTYIFYLMSASLYLVVIGSCKYWVPVCDWVSSSAVWWMPVSYV